SSSITTSGMIASASTNANSDSGSATRTDVSSTTRGVSGAVLVSERDGGARRSVTGLQGKVRGLEPRQEHATGAPPGTVALHIEPREHHWRTWLPSRAARWGMPVAPLRRVHAVVTCLFCRMLAG